MARLTRSFSFSTGPLILQSILPAHRRFDRIQRIRRGYVPVAAAHDAAAGAFNAGDRVHALDPFLAEHRQVQFHDPVVRVRPQRLEIGARIESGKPLDIIDVDQLQVRNVVAVIRDAVDRARGLKSIEPGTDSAVTDRMHVNLQPHSVEPGHGGIQVFGAQYQFAAIAVRTQVRVQQSGRLAFQDTVEKQLDAFIIQVFRLVIVACRQHVFEVLPVVLGETAFVGQTGHHPRGQIARPFQSPGTPGSLRARQTRR